MASLSLSASALAAKIVAAQRLNFGTFVAPSFTASDASILRIAPVRAHRCAAVSTEVKKVNDVEAAEEEEEEEEEEVDGPEAPNAFEIQSLLMELCDETKIAELKVKVGKFQLHVKRDIAGSKKAEAPLYAPPVPSLPMETYGAAAAPAAAPAPAAGAGGASASPSQKDADEGLVYVVSPRVGIFHRGKFFKGKRGRSQATEGAEVKVGQVVAYLEQLGTQVSIETEHGGEVVKFMAEDGDLVGYGDPIVAIRPNFPGIKQL